MEPGESLEETARRELYEETGLRAVELQFLDLLSGKEYYFQYPNGDEIYNCIALYGVKDWEGTPRINDDESLELGFFPMDNLPALEGNPKRIVDNLAGYGLFPEIRQLSMADNMTAAKVLEMQRSAYRVEAELIGTDEIPPLKETFDQLQSCGETFIGFFEQGELAGALSYEQSGGVVDIHRLIVDPRHFRKGIARKLLERLEKGVSDVEEFIVSTGADNQPAVTLYKKHGFKPAGETIVGGGIRLAHFTKPKRA